jgi:hypothetical protein
MKTLIGISFALASFVAQAQISTHTYMVGNKMMTCTTTCTGPSMCTTSCF